MDKRGTVFGILAQIFTTYGLTNVILNIFSMLFGRNAEGYSSMFSLAGKGISSATSFQFLLAAVLVILIRTVFMTDILIKKMSAAARIAAMISSVFAVITIFVFIFGWFPTDLPIAWILFVICFAVSCLTSIFVTSLAERQENRRLDEALKRIKEEK
ncbi:MAG: hypothetical protein II664_03395 [Oscillospiraceae bacterium]|nr:hypothetical protein [Oscillospiraceae bacterium]